MNMQEKKTFVRELANSITDSITALIDAGKIPEDWDGYELRSFFVEKAEFSRTSLSGSRKRAYRNAVIMNNL